MMNEINILRDILDKLEDKDKKTEQVLLDIFDTLKAMKDIQETLNIKMNMIMDDVGSSSGVN
jgi:hypothetical protein